MSKNRKKVESFILTYIGKIMPGNENTDIYKKLFANMSDSDFDVFIDELDKGTRYLSIIAPNFYKDRLSVDNNLKIAEELGHNFFQQLWIQGKGDIPTHLTPVSYLVIDLPLRRASQILIKKISVPENNRTVDIMTGQPTGESKGARISHPELQVAAAMGLEKSLIELMKYRGGDAKGGMALNAMLNKYGTANLSTLNNYASGVESTKTLKTFLTAAHLKSTL